MTSEDALETIRTALEESAQVKRRLLEQAPTILRTAERIAAAFR
ncbi:hypothetical protein BH24GEM2_BH24GEM2_10400 [soil metagenome]